MKTTTDYGQLDAMAQAVQALGPKLEAAQAAAALGPLLDAMKTTTDPSLLHAMAQAVEALVPDLIDYDARGLARAARSDLAWASSAEEAAAYAQLAVAGLPRQPVADFVVEIIELLKYPPAAGAATGVLLEALREVASDAPGKEKGLDATLDWLQRYYPAVDLDSPPHCPDPPAATARRIACPMTAS